MLSHGAHEKEFYYLGKASENRVVYLVEMVKIRDLEKDKEKWVPQIKDKRSDLVHTIFEFEIRLAKPLSLVDFSTYPKSKEECVQFAPLAEGLQVFEIVSIELPRKIDRRKVEFALIPGETFGITWEGLVQTQIDHEPYWRRRNLIGLLNLLRQELDRRYQIEDRQKLEQILREYEWERVW
ncbi:MAG TPA: hypothetical protein VFX17_00950 [Patescibacteria group bacterium]|nr:hypothetical protein [Patescibacteria group bacterium]